MSQNTKSLSLEQVKSKVFDVIVENLGVDRNNIKTDSNIIEDLGADSLDNVELIMACEETFGIAITEEDAETVDTVEDLINVVYRLID